MKTRVQAHVSYKLLYHIVWIPKRRYKVLKKGIRKYCDKVIRTSTSDRYSDVIIEDITVKKDHVHLIVAIPPKYSISKVVGDIKRDSSRKMRQKFEYLKARDAMWSIGYFVSSIGLNEMVVKRYVAYQKEQDSGQLKAVWDKEATGRAKRHP